MRVVDCLASLALSAVLYGLLCMIVLAIHVNLGVQVMLHVVFKRHMSAIQDSLGAEATQLLAQVGHMSDCGTHVHSRFIVVWYSSGSFWWLASVLDCW